MKIRNSFVSNSSSSSFIIFGKYIDDDVVIDVDALEDVGIEYYESNEGGICVGVDPQKMNLDETLRQFQTRIANRLIDAGIPSKPSELRIISGEYMN